jgi:hypothetical protein
MVGRQTGDQSQLFYLFNIEGHSSVGHLLLRVSHRMRSSRCLLKLLRQAPKGEGYAARLWRSMA